MEGATPAGMMLAVVGFTYAKDVILLTCHRGEVDRWCGVAPAFLKHVLGLNPGVASFPVTQKTMLATGNNKWTRRVVECRGPLKRVGEQTANPRKHDELLWE